MKTFRSSAREGVHGVLNEKARDVTPPSGFPGARAWRREGKPCRGERRGQEPRTAGSSDGPSPPIASRPTDARWTGLFGRMTPPEGQFPHPGEAPWRPRQFPKGAALRRSAAARAGVRRSVQRKEEAPWPAGARVPAAAPLGGGRRPPRLAIGYAKTGPLWEGVFYGLVSTGS